MEYITLRVNYYSNEIMAWGKGVTEKEARKNAKSVKVNTTDIKTITKKTEEWKKTTPMFYPFKGELI